MPAFVVPSQVSAAMTTMSVPSVGSLSSHAWAAAPERQPKASMPCTHAPPFAPWPRRRRDRLHPRAVGNAKVVKSADTRTVIAVSGAAGVERDSRRGYDNGHARATSRLSSCGCAYEVGSDCKGASVATRASSVGLYAVPSAPRPDSASDGRGIAPRDAFRSCDAARVCDH